MSDKKDIEVSDETLMEGGLLNPTKMGLKDKSLSKTSLKIKKSKRGKKYITIKGKKLYLTTLLKRINKKRVKSGKKPYKAITKRNLENTLLQLLFKDKILEKEKTKRKGLTTRLKRQRGIRGRPTAAQKRAARQAAVQEATLEAVKKLQPKDFDISKSFQNKIVEEQEKSIDKYGLKKDTDLLELIEEDKVKKNNILRSLNNEIINLLDRPIKDKKITKEQAENIINKLSNELSTNSNIYNNLFNFYGKNPLNKEFTKDQKILMPALQVLRADPIFSIIPQDINEKITSKITNAGRAYAFADKEYRTKLDLLFINKQQKELKEGLKGKELKKETTDDTISRGVNFLYDLMNKSNDIENNINILKNKIKPLENDLPKKKEMFQVHKNIKDLTENYFENIRKTKTKKSKVESVNNIVKLFDNVRKELKGKDKEYVDIFEPYLSKRFKYVELEKDGKTQKKRLKSTIEELKSNLAGFKTELNKIGDIKKNIEIAENNIDIYKKTLNDLEKENKVVKQFIFNQEGVLGGDIDEDKLEEVQNDLEKTFKEETQKVKLIGDKIDEAQEEDIYTNEIKISKIGSVSGTQLPEKMKGSGLSFSEKVEKIFDKLKTKQKGGMLKGKEKALDNFQIENHMKRYKNFYGVYPKDMLYKVIPLIEEGSRGGVVMNLDDKGEPGSHWVSIYWDADKDYTIEYFDSYGREPHKETLEDMKNIIKKLRPKKHMKLKINRIKNQHNDSVSCGYIAMRFLMDRYRGKNFKKATGYGINKSEDMAEKMYDRFNYLDL